ncbi:MAG: hypothetical protein WBZ57_24585, partial [Pseudomonas graminis]
INIVKPTGTLKVCRSVSIFGAVVASLYMFLADSHLRRNSFSLSVVNSMFPASIAFFGGALMTGLLSYWPFPKYFIECRR